MRILVEKSKSLQAWDEFTMVRHGISQSLQTWDEFTMVRRADQKSAGLGQFI